MSSHFSRRRATPFGQAKQHGYRQAAPKRGRGAKETIDTRRFIRAAKPVEVQAYTAKHRFADFAVNPLLQRNLMVKGYEQPTPIQDQAIPVGLEGKDVVGIANTGTGKTAAFALPVLNALMNYPDARALIMAPTRELAQQIEDECRALAKGSGLHGALLIGGSSMTTQFRDLSAKPRIVIGTPGRIKDHLQRRTLDLSHFTLVVLDEVDRMLDMGFINDMRTILGQLSDQRQSYFFSATLDYTVRTLIDSFANEPITISVKTGETSDNVEQNVVQYGSKNEQLEKLHDLLIDKNVVKSLVFHETKHGAEKLSKELQARGFQADAIHGGKSQSQRQRALSRFKKNEINVLVATDVAARGIDVADVTHVINFSLPQTYDDYVHRIGRAGRAGRKGHALTFIPR